MIKPVTTKMIARVLDEQPPTATVMVLRPAQGGVHQQLMEAQASTYKPWPGDLVTVNQQRYRIVTDL